MKVRRLSYNGPIEVGQGRIVRWCLESSQNVRYATKVHIHHWNTTGLVVSSALFLFSRLKRHAWESVVSLSSNTPNEFKAPATSEVDYELSDGALSQAQFDDVQQKFRHTHSKFQLSYRNSRRPETAVSYLRLSGVFVDSRMSC